LFDLGRPDCPIHDALPTPANPHLRRRSPPKDWFVLFVFCLIFVWCLFGIYGVKMSNAPLADRGTMAAPEFTQKDIVPSHW
jgi:hypothetical protein